MKEKENDNVKILLTIADGVEYLMRERERACVCVCLVRLKV
jgi:hypothetical protein